MRDYHWLAIAAVLVFIGMVWVNAEIWTECRKTNSVLYCTRLMVR